MDNSHSANSSNPHQFVYCIHTGYINGDKYNSGEYVYIKQTLFRKYINFFNHLNL